MLYSLCDIGLTYQSKEGYTALMMAAMEGRRETVQLLLDYGADSTLRDKKGLNARKHALRFGRKNTSLLLLKSAQK